MKGRGLLLLLTLALPASTGAQTPAKTPSLATAQRLFYNGDYEPAAAMALALFTLEPENLAAYELRTSALHFQIRREIGDAADKSKALKQCDRCASLMATFRDDTTRGLAIARVRLKADPQDNETLFFLGKLDLNHVWLHIGTLGKRTAWGEYREARRSMETLLKRDPGHVRARVAHAWMEYIVDTRVPFGFQWIFGGGDRKRALAAISEAASSDAGFFTKTEARFGLWEMLIREKKLAEAVATARILLADFPENRDLLKFLDKHSGL